MTNAQRIFALGEYGIVDKEVVIAITGMTNKQYEKAKQVKQANFYNGLFSDETKFKKSWVKRNRKSKYGYSLREEFVSDFIKANKSKYSIKDICSMVILGNIKVPIIVMENNLYKYLVEKQRKAGVDFSVFEKRINTFYQNKNDKKATLKQMEEITNVSTQSIHKIKSN